MLTHRLVEPGTHIVVNAGLDAYDDPLVPHFEPLLAATAPERRALDRPADR